MEPKSVCGFQPNAPDSRCRHPHTKFPAAPQQSSNRPQASRTPCHPGPAEPLGGAPHAAGDPDLSAERTKSPFMGGPDLRPVGWVNLYALRAENAFDLSLFWYVICPVLHAICASSRVHPFAAKLSHSPPATPRHARPELSLAGITFSRFRLKTACPLSRAPTQIRTAAPAIERARCCTRPLSLPDSTIHCPLDACPTISPTWCGHTTMAPTCGAAALP